MTDLERARLIEPRLKALLGFGNSPEDLARTFNLSLSSVKQVLGIKEPMPEPEPRLTSQQRSHLNRMARRGR